MHAKTMLRTAAVLAAAVAILAGSPLATAKGPITGTAPVSPQPEEDDLEAGLAVTYYYAYFEDVGDITRFVSGKPGEPIMILDHRTKSGKVLTARKPMGVGAEIRGLIKLDQAGSYIFRVLSNDGVELLIGGERLAYDPGIHGDRFTPPAEFVVAEPGWYALAIDYYQKKGTSALKLLWTPPGAAEETVVPAEAYGHAAD